MKQGSGRMLSLMTAAVLSMLAGAASAQQATAKPIFAPQGLPQDWSSHAVVYSNPDTPEEAAAKGRTAQWQRNYKDPRFVLSLLRKLQAQELAKNGPVTPTWSDPFKKHPKPPVESAMSRDWSNITGGGTDGGSGKGTDGVYPAKYSFNINAPPSCANDFVVYGTGTAGATATTGTLESRASAFSGTPAAGGTLTIGTPGTSRSVVLTASTTVNTGLFFQTSATLATNAVNLVAAIHRWVGTTGIEGQQLPLGGGNVRFNRTTDGNTATIPVTSTLTNYAIGAASNGSGAPGMPTIVAFNQLYNTTCDATRTPVNSLTPNVMWAYNTGTGKIVETSPVISYFDGGKQIAFIQRNPTPTPDTLELVLLKPGTTAVGTVPRPTVPPLAATAADYRNNTGLCATTAGCMFIIQLNGASTVSVATTSAPYVDYSGDVLWVGDGNGRLHKFTGVFGGTPAEVTATFPVTLSTGNNLSPPVYDSPTGNVFVGSDTSATTGGQFYRVNATSGAVITSARLAAFNTTGVVASPLLDSSAARVYAFVFDDDSDNDAVPPTACGGVAVAPPCKSVYQFTTSFAAGNKGTRTPIGHGNTGSATRAQYAGTFDDAYYTTGAGALYACGSKDDTTSITAMWKIPISAANVMGAPVQGAIISDSGTLGNCAPLSEVKNGTHDYLFTSIADQANDSAAVCGAGNTTDACIYMFDLSDLNGSAAGTGAAWGATNVPSAGMLVVGGTGGIVIDNVSATTGASQVYFSNLTAPGNAYQASQAGLQ